MLMIQNQCDENSSIHFYHKLINPIKHWLICHRHMGIKIGDRDWDEA